MKKTFLYRVWQYDRRLFFLFSGLAAVTLVMNLAGIQLTPFFVWGMYSEKEEPVAQYAVMRTTVNDSLVIDYSAGSPVGTLFYLQSPLSLYQRIQDNHGTDPTITFLQNKLGSRYTAVQPLENKLFNMPVQQAAFFPWYQRYLQEATGIPVRRIRVDRLQVHYNAMQELSIDTTYLLHLWERP